MKSKRVFLAMILMMAGLLAAAGLPGCAGTSGTTSETPAPGVTTTETSSTEATTATPAASGALRLWWSTRQSLNPLLDASASGQAVNRLVFEGLFYIDSYQQTHTALAEAISMSSDNGLSTALITLKSDSVFHDGTPVTAADVKASLDFILANPTLSPYAAALTGIIQSEAVDNLTLRLTLSQPDPWLACDLTFPVLPAVSLASNGFDLISGTGLFRMEVYSPETGLVLSRIEPGIDPSELTQIHVLEYANLTEAMKAFEDDQIDLVDLPPDEYSRYILRDSLRFEQYSSNQAIVLAYNTKQGHPLADAGRLIYIKRLLTSAQIASVGIGELGSCTGVPFQLDSFLLKGSVYGEEQALAGLGDAQWTEYPRSLVLLVPANDSLRADIAGLTGKLLEQAGLAWQLSTLGEAEYAAALNAGDYDLAILATTMPAEPDPSWLYGDNRPAAFTALSGITGDGLADYGMWRQRLAASVTLAALRNQPDAGVLAKNLFETAARAPWSVLLIRPAATLYGDRVVGQCMPDRYNPYRGIEELWIWSGQ